MKKNKTKGKNSLNNLKLNKMKSIKMSNENVKITVELKSNLGLEHKNFDTLNDAVKFSLENKFSKVGFSYDREISGIRTFVKFDSSYSEYLLIEELEEQLIN